ncbi:uncharacterized protein LOC111045259 isoform X2 [Nilaparvata lugens]|uniref:uncharacterized protein LOC111045259 isoform X2 n=1 Tax=Nilaparvata lugens TaxID=108931 RepID=UPI00193E6E3D|nr:uncharacterized protein LOC111045259 isoform X2 [Nilaparvata lugens]
MEVVELYQTYKFESREKYLALKWKISHVVLYLSCSLIGFVGSAVVRISERSLDQECLFYSKIVAEKDEVEEKWYVLPSHTVWSKHHCYGIMFVFTISFVYGMIWTVYFFTCSVSQYRYKIKRLESFHGCMDAAKLIYLNKDENITLEDAKGLANLIRFFGISLFFAWLLNSLLLLMRIFFWPDYNLMKEINIEFRLHDKPGKDVSELYKERVRVWRKFLKEKGLTGSIMQSIKEIEFTFPCLRESASASCELTDDYVYANEDAFNLAFTESSTATEENNPNDDDIDPENPLNFLSVETIHLSKRRQTVEEKERGLVSRWIVQELEELVEHITPNQDVDVESNTGTSKSDTSFDSTKTLKRRKDSDESSNKSLRKTL